jgi:PAP2 superfamily
MISTNILSNGHAAAAQRRPVLAERRAVLVMLATVGAAAVILTTATEATAGDVISVALRFELLALFLALMLGAAARFTQRNHPAHERFGGERAVLLIAIALLVGSTIPVFGIFKQFVLPLRGFPLDPALDMIDRLLFLGHDPWRVTHALLPSFYAAVFFDRLYSLWMPMMAAFPLFVVIALKNPGDRVRLIGCWLISWIVIGGLAAWILGSAGPCYYTALIGPHAGFADLHVLLTQQAALASHAGLPIAALDFQPMLLAAYNSGEYAPAGGISAAPSMHVAMATLFAIGGFRVGRWLGWAMVAFTAAIWIGSVHLGWHYAVDGLISVVLMLGIWRASALLVRRLSAPIAAS